MKKVGIVLITLAMMASFTFAAKVATPKSIDGIKGVVDADFVVKNIGKMKIYDVRKKAEYADGSIFSATWVPYNEKSQKMVKFYADEVGKKEVAKWKKKNLPRFTKNKKEKIIVFCSGDYCWKSYKTAVLLVKQGYQNIYWYRGGFPDWSEHNLKDEDKYEIE